MHGESIIVLKTQLFVDYIFCYLLWILNYRLYYQTVRTFELTNLLHSACENEISERDFKSINTDTEYQKNILNICKILKTVTDFSLGANTDSDEN